MNSLKLLCFCCSCDDRMFHAWNERIPAWIDLVAIKPKKDSQSLNERVMELYPLILQEIESGSAYAMFGHGTGSLVAYELSHQLQTNRLPGPVHLFFSSSNAPHIQHRQSILCDSIEAHLNWNYEYKELRSPFYCPITIVNGKNEEGIVYDRLGEWQRHSTKPCKIHLLEGDHSYIHEHTDVIVRLISSTLHPE